MAPSDHDDRSSDTTPQLRRALELARPAMVALAEGDLLPINLDPMDVVARVGGALPKLLPLKARIAAEFPNFDSSQFDRLEPYSRALLQAHTLYNATNGPTPELPVLSEEATQLRVFFLSDLKALVTRKQIPGACLAGLKHRKGHSNVASDILVAATILRNHWTAIANSTGVSEAELDRAEFLGTEILRLVHGRHRKAEVMVKAARDRERAYTLLVRTYNEVRLAVLFMLRKQADVNKLAPSLYSKRRRTKKAKPATEPDATARTVPTAAEVKPSGLLLAPIIGGHTSSTLDLAPETIAADPPRIPVGLPGSDPFVH